MCTIAQLNYMKTEERKKKYFVSSNIYEICSVTDT